MCEWWHSHPEANSLFLGLVKLILTIDLDSAIALGICDASQQPPRINLLIIEEQISTLINLSIKQNSSAGGAGTRTATVWGLNTLLLGGIEDEGSGRAFDHLINPPVFVGGQCYRVSEGCGGLRCPGGGIGCNWCESLGGDSKKGDGDGLGKHDVIFCVIGFEIWGE